MQSDSHITWWNAFKGGDWNAFRSLYEEFYALLNNYGYKFTRDADLVQDAIHDLFVRLWTTRQNLGSPASVKNYLYKSLRTLLFRRLQSRSRIVDLEGATAAGSFNVTFEQELPLRVEEQELKDQVAALVSKLSDRQREIVFLRFYEGLSYEEAADIMGISTNSAYKLLYKALDSLQHIVNKRFLLMLVCGLFILYNYASRFFSEMKG